MAHKRIRVLEGDREPQVNTPFPYYDEVLGVNFKITPKNIETHHNSDGSTIFYIDGVVEALSKKEFDELQEAWEEEECAIDEV
jgi:hypothetical protein